MVLLQSEFCDKKPMRKTLYTLLLPIIVCSCTGQEDKEEEYAGRMLNAARTLMTEGNYVAAKDSILAMRETFPTAFKARATGIIVMDSIFRNHHPIHIVITLRLITSELVFTCIL